MFRTLKTVALVLGHCALLSAFAPRASAQEPATEPAPGAATSAPAAAGSLPAKPVPPREDKPAHPARRPDGSRPQERRRGSGREDRKTPESLERVEVIGHVDPDTEARRLSTAAKMVFGRAELDRYGDTSIGEVLKRLPGITISGRPGRGGDIRMRGLGSGYTQILINGDPAPRGFSLDTLAPEQVERIEIYRAPIAEHSARAIAGTINVVLREELQRHQTELRLVNTEEQGHAQPGVSIQRSDKLDRFGYNVALNAFRKDQGNEVHTTTTGLDPVSGQPNLLQQEFDDSRSRGESLHLTARLNWRLDDGDALNLMPFLMQNRSATPGNSTLAQSIGATPAAFATANSLAEADTSIARLGGDWQHRFAGGASLRLRLLTGIANSDTSTLQSEYDVNANPSATLLNTASIRDRTVVNGGKFTVPLQGAGEWSAGWDADYGQRTEGALTVQDGVVQLAQFGSDLQASTLRLAGFAQRDWNLSPAWSTYAGLRWEGIRSTSSDAEENVDNFSSVWSPMLQSLWRLGVDKDEQIRLALTRTYRAPALNNLIARPVLSTRYPASGGNTPLSPDQIGNPALKPELALGLDLSFERYLSQGGILSASAFHRSIQDLMRGSTALETVSWSPVQRWVMQQQNVGRAQTSGIELEAKFRLAEFFPAAPALDLRTNYSRFWSTVTQIVGPDNRLDQQPKQTANIGLDDHLAGLPLTLGFNFNWTPSFEVQQSNIQLYTQGQKPVLDCYALWIFSPTVRLRASFNNLLHRDYLTGNAVLADTGLQTADGDTRTYLAWSLRLEIKL